MLFYIINLDRRKDKWDEVIKKFKKNKKLNKELNKENIVRISAFDGYDHQNELKRYNLENHSIIKLLQNYNSMGPKGVFGCIMSHIITLYNILLNDKYGDDDYFCICEDDLFLTKDFNDAFSKLKNSDLKALNVDFLYLGGRFFEHFDPYEDKFVSFDDFFIKTENPNIFQRTKLKDSHPIWERTTHSYIVRKGICKKLINLISMRIPSSIGFSFKPIDWIYHDLVNDIKMFDFFPHLFYSPLNYKTDIQNNEEILQF